MTTANIDVVLFDHDGTLVDSESTHLALWRKAIEPFGGHISDDEYWQQLLGVPAEQNAEIIIRLRQLDLSPQRLVEAKLQHTERFLRDSCFAQMPEADTVVRELAESFRLGLVSGSLRICVEASLRGHHWSSLFEQVVTGDDVSANKPNPDSYLHALQLMQLSAERCVAIEDTQSGVNAAAAAGIPVLAIRNQCSASHDFSAATAEVADLREARDWIMGNR